MKVIKLNIEDFRNNKLQANKTQFREIAVNARLKVNRSMYDDEVVRLINEQTTDMD